MKVSLKQTLWMDGPNCFTKDSNDRCSYIRPKSLLRCVAKLALTQLANMLRQFRHLLDNLPTIDTITMHFGVCQLTYD